MLRRGGNVILRGMGDCRFENDNDSLGIDGGSDWTVAFSATWEGSNALPTLAFGSYRIPDGDGCADSRLVRPAPTGGGYASPIALTPGYCTLSILFSDWNRSGERDLRMANDRNYYIGGEEQLWHVAPGQAPRLYTDADGWQPLQIWGMGIASQDLTGDGYPEVFITSQADNKLQTLADGAAQPTYRDIALDRGVTAQRPYTGGDVLPSTAWHPEFADVNNDGLVDLFITKGNVEAQPDYATRDPNDLLLGRSRRHVRRRSGGRRHRQLQPGPRCRARRPQPRRTARSRRRQPRRPTPPCGATWARVTPSSAAPMGHWIELRLKQPAPNVDAIGAWVDVTNRRTHGHP